MVNYADRFTPEQLDELYDFSFVKCSDEPLNFDSPLPATAPELSEDVRHILTALFDEHREKYPDEYLTPIEATLKAGNDAPADLDQIAEELEDLYLTFWHDVVFEIFKDRIEVKDDGTLWTKEGNTADERNTIIFKPNSFLTSITSETHYKKIHSLSAPLSGQLQMTVDKKGNISIIKDPQKIKDAIKELGNIEGVNGRMLDIILTAMETDFVEGGKGFLSIPRAGLVDAIGSQIYKPSEDELNYIINGSIPTPETLGATIDASISKDMEHRTVDGKEVTVFKNREAYEKRYTDDIKKRFGFWIDLVNLQKAGVKQTENGPFMLFNFEGYNSTSDSIECNSPYLRHVIEDIYNTPIIGDMHNNKPDYVKPKLTHRIKPSIYKVRNSVTSEIVSYIDYRLAKRGLITDAKLKPHLTSSDEKQRTIVIKYADIINNCPLLASKLGPIIKADGTTKQQKPQNKRNVLNRAIFGAVKLKNKDDRDTADPEIISVIKQHTVLYSYYKDLIITCDDISLKALNTTGIHIKHHGKNSDYEKEPTLNRPDVV